MKNSAKKRGFVFMIQLLIGSCIGLGSMILQAQETGMHFKTVWQGENGQNHMNILVVSALIEQTPLTVNDEIAVFSGQNCVGVTKLKKTVVPTDNSTFVSIFASQDDGSNNGFIENDQIVFKIWDAKNQKEINVNKVVYRDQIASWNSSGTFSGGSTSVVEIQNTSLLTQTIPLIKGNNLFSTYLIPSNTDMAVLVKDISDAGLLVSVQDEAGNSYAFSPKKKEWTNSIGSLEKTEGYLINVTANCDLKITGKLIDLPMDIPLQTGWNYISFPSTAAIDAMKLVKPLIDQQKLIKVQDEKGNSIETVRKSGVWVNNIGIFEPGKAYKINVSSNAVIRIQ